MPEIASAPAELPLEKAAPVLAMHVRRVQARMAWMALGTGVAMALPILVLWLAVEMPLDLKFELPRWARGLFLAAGLGSAAAIVWRFGVRPWLHRPGPDSIGLAIERALPELRSRFIASIQLSRRPEDHGKPLVRALVKETGERARELDFNRVVPTAPMRRWWRGAFAACLLGAGLWWLGGDSSWPLFQRAWLLNTPRPTATQIVDFTGNRVMALGDDIRLEATAAGAIPFSGRIKLQTPPAKPVEYTFDADPSRPSTFYRSLHAVQQGFRYRIELGDARTEWAEVQVRPRPVIQELEFQQHWPEYTGLPPQRRTGSDLKLLAGSKLLTTLQPNVPLRQSTIQLLTPERKVHGSFQMVPVTGADSKRPRWQGTAQIPAKAISGLTFLLADEAGVESKAMAVYRVETVPDEAPTLEILWPQRREELVTSRATLLVGFEAKDDFGVDRVKLHYAVNWIQDGPHQTLEMDLGSQKPKVLTRRFEWRLSRLDPPLREGDVIDYWFEVSDSNNVTGPGVAIQAEHYQARVVSDEEKRAGLAARLSDTLQGLNDLRLSQEEVSKRLGEIIYEKKP